MPALYYRSPSSFISLEFNNNLGPVRHIVSRKLVINQRVLHIVVNCFSIAIYFCTIFINYTFHSALNESVFLNKLVFL